MESFFIMILALLLTILITLLLLFSRYKVAIPHKQMIKMPNSMNSIILHFDGGDDDDDDDDLIDIIDVILH